jgi:hypothetical protein
MKMARKPFGLRAILVAGWIVVRAAAQPVMAA